MKEIWLRFVLLTIGGLILGAMLAGLGFLLMLLGSII